MSEHKTLLQFLLDLLHDKQAQADFKEDPQGALHDAGLDHVCVQDIQHLLPVVLEKVDPEKCAKYEDDCDNGHCHDDQAKHQDHDGHRDHGHDHHDDDHKWHDHDNEIDKVVTHLNYVVNNYSYDSHDTIYNTNNVTKIWADHGANVDVNNETHNVGAGGVDVEGNNSGPITTGHGNVVGDGNQIADHGANAAFGAGSTALSNVGANDGGAINTGAGGSASGSHTDAHLNSFGGGAVQNGTGNVATDIAQPHVDGLAQHHGLPEPHVDGLARRQLGQHRCVDARLAQHRGQQQPAHVLGPGQLDEHRRPPQHGRRRCGPPAAARLRSSDQRGVTAA